MAAFYISESFPPPPPIPSPSSSSPKHHPDAKKPEKPEKVFESHETYMNAKQIKLRNQFTDMRLQKMSSIFDGVTIYVNGWTQPRADELKEMIFAHGGRYEYNIYSNSVVTHTIASNLPNAKILKLGSSIVCKPSWIVDSIAANTLLPVENYLLYKPKGGQKKLDFSARAKVESVMEEDAVMDDLSEGYDGNVVPNSLGNRSSKKGAEFVNEFFTHSRLHYLSTWSMELKQFTANMLKKITPRLPKLPFSASINGLKMRAVVHIDLDCFFVSVSLRDKPHLRGKPVAVTHAKGSTHSESKTGDSMLTSEDSHSESRIQTGDLRSGPVQSSSWTPQDSTSDIASCSYEARAMGVSNGMSVGTAIKKCPDLIFLPYDFNSYREVSQTFYESLLHYSSVIEAVSCDEAYVELTDYCRDFDHVSETVKELRNEVERKTGCTVSAGIAHNMLLARMCTRVAKPDGQFHLPASETNSFLDSQRVRDLPGVGYSTAIKLGEMNVENCKELRSLPVDVLQTQFGTKLGKTLHEYAHGVDDRQLRVTTERKSVSVDINFGVRFQTFSDAETLVRSLAEELEKRAEQAEVFGNQLTLKMKIRKKNAPMEPKKFLGHGACDNISRSLALLQPSRTALECSSLAIKLLKQLNPVVTDIRGMGLQLNKLTPTVGSVDSGSSKRAGADLKKLLLQGSAKKPHTSSSVQSDHYPSLTDKKPSLSLKGKKASPNKILGKSPRKPSRKSPYKSPKKPQHTKLASNSMKAPAVKSLKHYFGVPQSVPQEESSKKVLEDSFRIELPPASQLDLSVLEALPLHIRQKVMQGYASRGLPLTKGEQAIISGHEGLANNAAIAVSVDNGNGVDIEESSKIAEIEEIAIDDEKSYLSAWKQYISDWCTSFPQGPNDSDACKISDYLCKLAGTNLEMTELCLKSFKHLAVAKFLPDETCWHVAYNVVLEAVQERISTNYGGFLNIDPIII